MEIPTPIPTPSSSVPVPVSTKKNFFTSKKRINRSAIFLIIAGIGAMWLTYWWNKAGRDGTFNKDVISHSEQLNYYIFNSAMMMLVGILLLIKSFRLYSIFAIILGVSVTSSLFIIDHNNGLMSSLFIDTTIFGMTFGVLYGGIILVPAFLFGVYSSLFKAIRYFSANK